MLSPTTSLGSSATRHQLLGQALRLSSLNESRPSAVTAAGSLSMWPSAEQASGACAGDGATPSGPAALLVALDGPADADDGMPDPSVWETVFMPPAAPKEPWHAFESGPMFAGEDELDAHAAAVLAAENDLDAMADAMEHAAAAVPLPPVVGGSVSGSPPPPVVFVPLDPAPAEPTLLGAPSPVIVVRRADPRPELASITAAKPQAPSPVDAVSEDHYWGSPLVRIPRCVPDSSLDSFETATGYDPPEMPGQGDWSADEGNDSEASAPRTPRGCNDSDVDGGYGSEDDWTPACMRRTARRSRTSCTGAAARGAGSQSNSPTHHAGGLHLATGVEQPGRAAAARVREIVRAFGSDADEDDPGESTPRPSARRGAGGKRRRSPAGVADSHDSDGNPRHKRHNPWCGPRTRPLRSLLVRPCASNDAHACS